ncbi:MAG: Type II secretion system protein F [Phycisphaerae bacterium]|nr:Type II secretion system protein F [Phycisphaerae bacterium]
MIKFNYVARDSSGQSINGTVSALTPAAASRQLRQEGKFLLRLEAASAGASGPVAKAAAASQPLATPSGSRRGIKRKDLIYVTTQMAVMAETGVPLADALDSICDQMSNQNLQAILKDVAERVKSGEEFSSALGRYPKLFSAMYVAMVKAAEASGTLGVMLERIAEYLTDEEETRKKVRGALVYPVSMLVFALAVTVFLMAFVLPKFTAIYAQKQAALPVLTKVVMGISNFMVTYWIHLVIGTAAATTGLVFFFRSEGGKDWWAGAKLKIPLLGSMFHKAYMTRCLRTLGTLIATGVSMLEAVEITRRVAGRGPFGRLWENVDQTLRGGQQLSDPLLREPLIPRSVAQMISAGERTGTLPNVLERVAGFSDRELKNQIKTITSMIEPIMISLMGLIVGTIVMALLMPIFTISKVMTTHGG